MRVRVCISVYVQVWVWTCVYVCVWEPFTILVFISVLTPSLLLYFPRTIYFLRSCISETGQSARYIIGKMIIMIISEQKRFTRYVFFSVFSLLSPLNDRRFQNWLHFWAINCRIITCMFIIQCTAFIYNNAVRDVFMSLFSIIITYIIFLFFVNTLRTSRFTTSWCYDFFQYLL